VDDARAFLCEVKVQVLPVWREREKEREREREREREASEGQD